MGYEVVYYPTKEKVDEYLKQYHTKDISVIEEQIHRYKTEILTYCINCNLNDKNFSHNTFYTHLKFLLLGLERAVENSFALSKIQEQYNEDETIWFRGYDKVNTEYKHTINEIYRFILDDLVLYSECLPVDYFISSDNFHQKEELIKEQIDTFIEYIYEYQEFEAMKFFKEFKKEDEEQDDDLYKEIAEEFDDIEDLKFRFDEQHRRNQEILDHFGTYKEI